MPYLQVLLTVVILTFASGAIQSARPEEDPDQPSVTLYTPVVNAFDFHCNASNVSHKPLDMRLTIIDAEPDDANPDGTPKPFPASGNDPAPRLSIPPGAVASQDAVLNLFPAQEGYCKIEVFGTRNRNDVRAALTVHIIRTFVDPLTTNSTRVATTRTLEGH